MAESTDKKLTLSEALNTVSISERDKWVLNKLYAGNTEKKTRSAWVTAIKKHDITIATASNN